MARKSGLTTSPVAAPWPPVGRDPIAPESFSGSQSKPNVDWPGLVGAGENSNGFRAITPNGIASDHGNGDNQRQYSWNKPADGERFGGKVDWDRHKNANRTGE